MRHSYWCALAASTQGVDAFSVTLVSKAHEASNRFKDKWPAFASTMDLHNNNVGINTIHTLASGLPDRNAIKEDLTKKYTTGEMYIWEIPKGFTDVKEDQSEGIIIKSNLTRVFP